jgi:hypothetical protein
VIGTALLLGVGLVSACSGPPPTGPYAVVRGWYEKVRPTDRASGSSAALLFAARNESESFQVEVHAALDTPLSGVTVSAPAPLTGPGGAIPVSNIIIYREAYYDVTQTSDSEGSVGLWPDALIPTKDRFFDEDRNAFPVDIPAGQNRVAWVDIVVPGTQTPGDYQGALAVAASGFSATIPVTITVTSFTLPATSTLRSAFQMGYDTPCLVMYTDDCFADPANHWAAKARFVQAGLDDRISISVPQFEPLISADDVSKFETYILPFLAGTGPTQIPGAELTSIQVDAGTYLPAWRDEAVLRGFADRAFVYACDEPDSQPDVAGAWSGCKAVASDALGVWPGVRTLVTATINQAQAQQADGLIRILVPVVNDFDDKPGSGSVYVGDQGPNYAGFVGSGEQVWLYTSCLSEGCNATGETDPYWVGWPGYVTDAPATEARAMGWLSFLYGTSGELYFAVDKKFSTAWTDQLNEGGQGDGTLFYPGTPELVGGTEPIPIESIRLKYIRDGYEDYEYLHFLAANSQGDQAEQIARDLFANMYSTNQGGLAVSVARFLLAQRVQLITGGPSP